MAAVNPNTLFTHHVAMLVFPFGTHAGPLLDLVNRLAAAAPRVLFTFFTTSASNTSLLSKLSSSLKNVNPHDIGDGLPEGFVPSGKHFEIVELFMKAARANFRTGFEKAEAATGLRIRCLLADAFLWFVGDMAKEMNVPWVPVWTSGPRSMFLYVETDFIRQKLGTTGEKTSLDFLPGFSKFQTTDLPGGIIQGIYESPMAILLDKVGQELPKAPVVVINSFEELDPEIVIELKSRFHQFLNVGPFSLTSPSPPPPLLKDESGCLEWLDKHKPASVAYIGFGTVAAPSPQELAAFGEALVESEIPFIWSFRGDIEDVLPKGCDKSSLNGKIVTWAPQVQVLGHASIGVFVTHCGWNSILEAIVGVVPMIGRPFFSDQMVNMKTVEAIWGIGVGLEGRVITKDGVIKALELILKNKEGNEMREQIKVLKNLALKAVQFDGSSTRALNFLVEVITK